MGDTVCFPLFARGSGLGTRLFPWARCVVYSSTSGVPMIAPRWTRLAIRALFRGGRDLRHYRHQILLSGVFKAGVDEIAGYKRLRLLSSSHILKEPPEFRFSSPVVPRGVAADGMVLFESDADKFERLNDYRDLLLRRFTEMVRTRWVNLATAAPSFPIGLNVRRGMDFRDATHPQQFFEQGGLRTPLSWFRDTLQAVRRALGYTAPAVVVSDGTRNDLEPLLSMDKVLLLRPGCAASDLLVLSRTRILIGSGGSAFSAWASFFGQMPTVTVPGQGLTWFNLRHRNGAVVGEFDPGMPNLAFLEQCHEVAPALRSGNGTDAMKSLSTATSG